MSCQLVAILSENSWARRVPSRSHMVTLNGAREPNNNMLIIIDPFIPHEQGIPCCII